MIKTNDFRNSQKKYPIYNVGPDKTIPLDDLSNKLEQFYNIKAETPLVIEGKVDRYIPSIEKAQVELGLYVKHDLLQSVKETIRKICLLSYRS